MVIIIHSEHYQAFIGDDNEHRWISVITVIKQLLMCLLSAAGIHWSGRYENADCPLCKSNKYLSN